MAAPPVLAVDGVSLRHGSGRGAVLALDRISFDIRDGERLVLLGPSGCGKSSLLNAVAGFLPVTGGEVRVRGRAVGGPGPDRMVVFQEFDQLLPWRTVSGNIALPLRVAGGLDRRAAAARAADLLARVGLTEFADAYPHTLSGGMKQRVAIARALAMQPDVLLMDEPFAALDALTRQRMQLELTELWSALRFTLLFVTHGIDEAIVVGSRILVLSARPGRIVADIDVSDIGRDDRGSARFAATERHLQDLLVPRVLADA